MIKQIVIVISFLILGILSFSQVIPNQGFENWTNAGPYEMPDNWDNLNTTTAGASVFTCSQGTPGNPGQFFLELTSRTVTGMGVVPGVAVCGILDQTTRQPVSGYPMDQRPEKLSGKWQYMMYGSDKGFIDISMTKWNPVTLSRDVVANGHVVLSGMEMSWKAFSVTLNYLTVNNPDSCIIFLSASGNVPANHDYLYVDDLAFTGNVPNGTGNDRSSYVPVSIYPVPADDNLRLIVPESVSGELFIQIFNTIGQRVISQPVVIPVTSIRTGMLPNGIYSYSISGRNKSVVNTGKIMVLHK